MLKKLSIKQKMTFWNISIIFIFSGVLFFLCNNALNLLMLEKQNKIKAITDSAAGIVYKYIKLEKDGKLSHEKAMEAATENTNFLRYDEGNYIFIDDNELKQIANPIHPENKGQPIPTTPDMQSRLYDMMAKNGPGKYFYYSTTKPGTTETLPKVSFIKFIPEWKWLIGTGVYLDDIVKQKSKYILEISSIYLVFFIFLMVISILFSNSIIIPLAKLAASLLTSSNEMESKSLNLSKMSEEVGNSSKAQADSIQETATAIAEVTSMIARTAKLTEQSKDLAHVIVEGTQNGDEAVKQMVSSMEAIQESSQKLSEIKTIIKEIESKTMVINEIVSKTELLSLNASIEAARAGEFGKGFAVVAEEVGNLANTSGKSSNEIKELLEKSRVSVQDILQLTVQRVTGGQEKTRSVTTTFEKITLDVNNINTQMQQITEATKEQEIGVKQISTAMARIDSLAINNLSNAEKSVIASSEVFDISKVLKNISKETEDIIFGENKKVS
jgi:methyl-accepting chemotaxis protein